MFTRSMRSQSLTIVYRQQMAQIKTFAFLDLETTGLPFMENNRTRITELTVLTVQSEHLSLGVIPRVQNKLSLCFNPQKLISYDSERITGLSNDLLEHSAPFSSHTVQLLNAFLEQSPKPICFVAHNGNRFDYPILRAEIEKTRQSLMEGILCIDSLEAFRQLHIQKTPETKNEPTEIKPVDIPDSIPLEFQDGFDEMLCQAMDEYENDRDLPNKGIKKALDVQKLNETTPKRPINNLNNKVCDLALKRLVGDEGGSKNSVTSNGREEGSNSKKLKIVTSRRKLNFGISFKLVDVYQRLTSKEAENAHQAENDVVMLATCAATLGDSFIGWANQHVRMFSDVPMMVPGRKMI